MRFFLPAFRVLVRTGLRAGELCALEARDIDYKHRLILLRAETTKTKYARQIPVSDTVLDILRALGKQLFSTRQNGRQTVDNLNRRFRTVLNRLERAGRLPDTRSVSIHTLRKTYISHLIMAGVDPATVMAIVGHREWSTIRRYLALAPGHVAAGAGKLPY